MTITKISMKRVDEILAHQKKMGCKANYDVLEKAELNLLKELGVKEKERFFLVMEEADELDKIGYPEAALKLHFYFDARAIFPNPTYNRSTVTVDKDGNILGYLLRRGK